ncbi:hypothetical protein ARMSODRAFT_1024756 [Armillaria solidipes]|uniref:Uncharacterized protein n=1 Tax=Armillaria solidipes TaxID=1076256 RepID=A0A2H3BHL2_9AGAR|nr:hypothetical protein ARMSODRAFT_1024756 [Armillaria solidipes]
MEVLPPDLSQDDRRVILSALDKYLNYLILESLLHGVYTGIVAVTLWAMFTSMKRLHGTFLRTIIITLYVLSTIVFAIDWVFERRAFIDYGYNCFSMFLALSGDSPWHRADSFIDSIPGGISTILVDVTIRCWTLWDRQWRVVLIPIMCSVVATAIETVALIVYLILVGRNMTAAYYADIIAAYMKAIAPTFLVLRVAVRSTSSFSDEESTNSGPLSDINFGPTGENNSSLNSSDQSVSGSRGTNTTEIRRDKTAADYTDLVLVYIRAIAPILLILRVAATPDSSSGDKESDVSINISDINFRPMGENTNPDNPSEWRFSGSRGMYATETV